MKFLFNFFLIMFLAGCRLGAQAQIKKETSPLLKKVLKSELVPAPAMPGLNVPAIKVNTAGYSSGWIKLAIFNVDPAGAFLMQGDQIIMRAKEWDIRQTGIDKMSQDLVWQVDFSALRGPGKYYFKKGKQRSDIFVVSGFPYKKALKAAAKNFYYQRCRTPLKEPYTHWDKSDSDYTRTEACHTHKEIGWVMDTYPDKKERVKMVKGWHDAGNYDMYVFSTAPTAQVLMRAYELRPALFGKLKLDIPESKNNQPDILDEVRWGLDWILSMQMDDGSFRAQVAVYTQGEGSAAPAHLDQSTQWLTGPSSTATAKACAALAQASRVYARIDAAYARRCGRAAKKAWAWLKVNPRRVKVNIHGSDQPRWDDDSLSDVGAKAAAALEMFRVFGDKQALSELKLLMKKEEMFPQAFITGAWANISRFALVALAGSETVPVFMRQEAKKRVLRAADSLRRRIEKEDGYRCATEDDGYYWGSNSNLSEKALLLMDAYRLGGKKYAWAREAARDQWHWLMGRNPNGFSMVTRVGKGPERFYHAEWANKKTPPPGYLIGGPNHTSAPFLAPNAPAKALLWDNPRAMRTGLEPHALWHNTQSDFWDGKFIKENTWTTGWWTVMEGDILYNANLVALAAEMQ